MHVGNEGDFQYDLFYIYFPQRLCYAISAKTVVYENNFCFISTCTSVTLKRSSFYTKHNILLSLFVFRPLSRNSTMFIYQNNGFSSLLLFQNCLFLFSSAVKVIPLK